MVVAMSTWKSIVDKVIEAPVVTSFTSIGPALRSRLDDWTSLDSYDLIGRRIVLTGGTSGLGLAAAERFTSLGATLLVVGRSRDKTERICAGLPVRMRWSQPPFAAPDSSCATSPIRIAL